MSDSDELEKTGKVEVLCNNLATSVFGSFVYAESSDEDDGALQHCQVNLIGESKLHMTCLIQFLDCLTKFITPFFINFLPIETRAISINRKTWHFCSDKVSKRLIVQNPDFSFLIADLCSTAMPVAPGSFLSSRHPIPPFRLFIICHASPWFFSVPVALISNGCLCCRSSPLYFTPPQHCTWIRLISQHHGSLHDTQTLIFASVWSFFVKHNQAMVLCALELPCK